MTGIAVLDIPGIEKSVGAVAPGALYWAKKLEQTRLEEVQNRIDTLLQHFQEVCKKEGVKFHTAEEQGSPSERIIWESMFYDLVVMGLRTFYHFEVDRKPGKSLDQVLSHTITPILAVPERFYRIKNVLITFNGSLPAARALQRFVHLAIPYDFHFTLLYAGDDMDTANLHLDKAEEYLKAYAIRNIQKKWSPKPLIQVLEEEYLNWADVIVLGAHSRKGVLDFLVGSVTRFLINEGNKVLFIGQ